MPGTDEQTDEEWSRDFDEALEDGARRDGILVTADKRDERDDFPHDSWTLEECYAWASKCPRRVKWMNTTWWTPLTGVPMRRTDSMTTTCAFISIGDVPYAIMFCFEVQTSSRLRTVDRYWRSFGATAIEDIAKHCHNWTPPEDYW